MSISRDKEGLKRDGQKEAYALTNPLHMHIKKRNTCITNPLHMHIQQRNACRHPAVQQWPNDVVLRPHRKIQGMRPRTDTFNAVFREGSYQNRSIKRYRGNRQHTRTSGLTWVASPFNKAKVTGCKNSFSFSLYINNATVAGYYLYGQSFRHMWSGGGYVSW